MVNLTHLLSSEHFFFKSASSKLARSRLYPDIVVSSGLTLASHALLLIARRASSPLPSFILPLPRSFCNLGLFIQNGFNINPLNLAILLNQVRHTSECLSEGMPCVPASNLDLDKAPVVFSLQIDDLGGAFKLGVHS